MAVTAAVVGGALVAGGTAAAIKAQQMKTKAKGVQYGGSREALSGYRDIYAQGIDRGGSVAQQSQAGLAQGSAAAQQLAARGNAAMDQAGQVQVRLPPQVATRILAGYQPGAVSEAAARRAMDANAAANLGAAGARGGQIGIRNAVNANAFAGVDAAQNIAAQRAEEEQAYIRAQMDQANLDQQIGAQAYDTAQAERMQLLQYGAGVAGQANQQQIAAAGTLGQQGLTTEGQYLNQLAGVEERQLAADLDYERRRQADQQRKSQNLFGLGSSMITGGARVAGGAAGGGGG